MKLNVARPFLKRYRRRRSSSFKAFSSRHRPVSPALSRLDPERPRPTKRRRLCLRSSPGPRAAAAATTVPPVGTKIKLATHSTLQFDENDVEPPKTREMFRTILSHVWPEDNRIRRRVVGTIGLMLFAKGLNVVTPFVFKWIVDAATITNTNAGVLVPFSLVVGYGISRFSASAFREMQGAVFTRVTQNGVREMSDRTFAHLHNLDLKFHLDRKTGQVSRVIDRGSKAITFLLNTTLLTLGPTLLEVGVVCYILGAKYGPEFFTATVATIGCYTVFTTKFTQWRTQFRKNMNTYDNKAHSHAVDSLINYETVKYFSNEDLERTRYLDTLRKYQDAAERSQMTLSALNTGQNFIFSSGLAVLLTLGAQGVSSGALTVGDLVLMNSLLFQLSVPLNFIGSAYREFGQALIDFESMMTLLKLQPRVKDGTEAIQIPESGGEVEFRDVRFGYTADRQLLKGLSLKIPAGKSCAIVGASGCGKSSIIRLLFRFYDMDAGKILVDGKDISKVKQADLRRSVGVVPQDVILFNDTIKYNIGYGDTTAPDEAIYEASRQAKLHNFVSELPQGYDTPVGERGLKLSGGEKQRCAIARMVMKRPSIILCDEATSSLDSATESEILANLKEICKSRTTIFIAHRLSTVMDVDIIFVMEDGKIVEKGTHDELLETGGVYHALWELQSTCDHEDHKHGPRPSTKPAN